MSAEKQFEHRIRTFLESVGVYDIGTPKQKMTVEPIGYYEKRWGGGKYIKEGLPDYHIAILGFNIEIEVKSATGKPSATQIQKLSQIRDSFNYGILLYPKQFEAFQDLINAFVNVDTDEMDKHYKRFTPIFEKWKNKLL